MLVTGGAGFVGSHLVDALVERGARVRVLDDLSTGRLENLERSARSIELVEGDLRRRRDCERACQGVELVFHQAALGSVPRSIEDPATTLAVNAQGSAELLAAAHLAKVRRVNHASSSSVYGDSPENPRCEGREGCPLSPYAASKSMVENLAVVFHRVYELEVLGLRYFNVYGPRQDPSGPYAAVVPRFFHAVLAGEPVPIYGDGLQTRDFTFVADAVRSNLLAAAAPAETADGVAVNVGGGGASSVLDLAAAIAACLGREHQARHGSPRPGDVRHSAADLTLARRLLGYRPSVELAEGLQASRRYYETIALPARA